jgi:hypothetical protein
MKKSDDTDLLDSAPISCEDELQLARKRLLFYTENTSMGFIKWDEQLHVKTWSKRGATNNFEYSLSYLRN